MADARPEAMVPNLSGMATIQRERALEQGQFRQSHMAPTPGRRKAMSNPTPFNASKRKTSDSPTPAPAPKKPRTAGEDAYLRILRDFNREIEEPREISAGKAQDVLEKVHIEGYSQLVRRNFSTCILSRFPIDITKTKCTHNMPPSYYIAMVKKFYYSTQRNQSLICHCLSILNPNL